MDILKNIIVKIKGYILEKANLFALEYLVDFKIELKITNKKEKNR